MTLSGLLAAAFAAVAAAIAVPPAPGRLMTRRGVVRGSGPRPGRSDARSGRQVADARSREAPHGRHVPAIGGRGLDRAADALATLRTRTQSRGQVARRRAAVIELCTAFAAELRAGSMPAKALSAVASTVPGLCDEAAREAQLGGDTVTALRAAATRPGAEGLARLAAAWAVTELTGSGLADGCERVASRLRDEESLRREVAAQLAGARASARLLSLLPLVGLALGAGIGGDPIGFLLGSPYGLACLVGGAVLVLSGLWWTERLAHSVEAGI